MRQNGPENRMFVGLLHRLRNGACDAKDYEQLSGRTLQGQAPADQGEWHNAPIIVSSNATRDAINRKATEAFAE
jgi:hypothetical protein